MAAVAFSLIKQTAIGAACGAVDFLFSTTCQKTCMLAGVKFEDEEEVPASQRLDKYFWKWVIKAPIREELAFRNCLQPLLAKGFLLYMPQLAAPAWIDIPLANMIAAPVIGAVFAAYHYPFYKSGGIQMVLVASISGSFYGIIKERFGLAASMSAHMVHNFMAGWFDKHYPAFLDSSEKIN